MTEETGTTEMDTDTDTDTDTETERTYRPTLGEMSHTNPYTGDVFGATQTYGRGRAVAADGGRDADRQPEDENENENADANADAEPPADADAESATMQDVDHTPPDDGDGAAPVYERGHEGKEGVR